MRIIAGELRGRILKTGKVEGTRPTSDMVRESLFNVIAGAVPGARVLDLFAGFGGLGIEALSRGAVSAVFVEKNRRCADIIRENLDALGLAGRSRIMMIDAFRAVEKLSRTGEKFHIVFIDAPYHKKPDAHTVSPNQNLLHIIDNSDILEAGGLVVIERFKKDRFEFFGRKLSFLKEKEYGDTCLAVYRFDKQPE
ncbi:MAG TPA: 16S rRNA (guanine(966)-N(2))-methyltransferase RsmD [bacterium]|nr:16S rRNA (guanine(966)-N(2))-methyltransferase RsmD [bacterium]